MTAPEWIAAMRTAGVTVYLDPRPGHAGTGFLLSWPVELRREAWAELDAVLEDVGRKAVFDELHREAATGRARDVG